MLPQLMGKYPETCLIGFVFFFLATSHGSPTSSRSKENLASLSTSEAIQDLVHAISTVHCWDPNAVELVNTSSMKNLVDESNTQVKHMSLILNMQEVDFYLNHCEGDFDNSFADDKSTFTPEIHYLDLTVKSMKSEFVWMNRKSSNFLENEEFGKLVVLDLKRTLIGNGAHRQLSSRVTIELQGPRSKGACNMVLLERLPQGVFVDTFELQRLVDRGVFQNARVFGDLNLELPAFNSHPSIVVLHITINPNSSHLGGSKQRLQENVVLPLHARYPPLNRESHGLVNIGLPTFLFDFVEEDPVTSVSHLNAYETKRGKSIWISVVCRESLSKYSVLLQWAVPAGNPLHTKFVAGTTFTTALMGVVVLLLVASHSRRIQ